MTSPLLSSDSNKINSNVDPNVGSNSVTHALTNACIIVPVVCFVGTVMTVILGVTMCKMNRTCEKCLLHRMFQGRERDCAEMTSNVYARTTETDRTVPRDCPTCFQPLQNPDPQDPGISNPLYHIFSRAQVNNVPEAMSMSTFKPGFPYGRNSNIGALELDVSDASKIANCSGSSLEKRSLSSSGDTYQERIKNFLGDPVLTFYKGCRPTVVPVREPPGSFHPGSSSLLTLNTFVDDSSHTGNELDSVACSFLENRPLSDVSRIVHYSRSPMGSVTETLPMDAASLHLRRFIPDEHQAAEVLNLSSDSQESFSTTYIRAPPPSPNTDNLSECTQVENLRCSNGNCGLETRPPSVLVEERTQSSWVTVRSIGSREQSLEWDNYQPSLAGCFADFASPRPETPSTLVPLEEQGLFCVKTTENGEYNS